MRPSYLAILVVLLPVVAAAQVSSPERRGYVGLGVSIVRLPTGPEDYHLWESFSGAAPEVTVALGRRVEPGLGFELEVGIPAAITMDQRYRGPDLAAYTASQQDFMFMGLVRVPLGPARAIQPVAGGGVALGRSGRSDVTYTGYLPGAVPVPGPDERTTRLLVPLSVGIDIVIPAGRRWALGPGVRYTHVGRRPVASELEWIGVSAHRWRIGFAAFTRF